MWNGNWYGGHHVPAYSILFPPLAALLGPQLVGALSAVGAAWAVEKLALQARGPAGRPAALWFAAATAISLVTGRLTFALGLAFGAAALLALARERRTTAVLLALATALASPVAGAFLALVAAAHGVATRRLGPAVALCGAAVVPSVVLSVAFPEGGDFPFAADAFWPSLAATLLVIAVIPREDHVLRLAAALYAALLVVSFALPTPMGGNAVRLGALAAGPIAALVLWPQRRKLLLLLAPAFLYWQLVTPIDNWARADGDPSVHAEYYAGLVRFLQSRPPARVEVPFTEQHWETTMLARGVPIARGWERQLDRRLNPLFYDGSRLTPERHRRWLGDNAVGYVALATTAPLDYSAVAEARLVRERPSYLREVWRDRHWRVFAVRDATPLASGGARVVRYGADDLVLDVPRAGTLLLRVRWTPYWRIAQGRGCVAPRGDWTELKAAAPGRVHLVAEFDVSRIRASSPRCTAGTA